MGKKKSSKMRSLFEWLKLLVSYLVAFTLLLILVCINISLSMLLSIVNFFKNKLTSICAYKKNWSEICQIKTQLKSVQNFQEWYKLANKYDQLTGLKKWRINDKSRDYDYKYIAEIEKLLTRYIDEENIQELVSLIRSTTTRDIGGILHPSLYEQALSGTKDLISSYQKKVCQALKMIALTEKLTHKEKFQIISELKSSYGRTSLLLSGGGQLGIYHFGFIKQLVEHKIMPKVIAGSSAGSIIAAGVGCLKKEELLRRIKYSDWVIKDFPNTSWLLVPLFLIMRIITNGGSLLTIEGVRQIMNDSIGDITFMEAFHKTGYILNVTVSDPNKFESFKVLNYLTAPNVLVRSAVTTSCSMPLLMGASTVMCKNEFGSIVEWLPGKKMFIDGCIDADLPKRRISEMFNTNYSIASQANPYVIPFMSRSKYNLSSKWFFLWKLYEYFAYFIYSEIQHRSRQLVQTGLQPNVQGRLLQVGCQKYTGDITVNQKPTVTDLIQCMINPTPERIQDLTQRGEKMSFHEIKRIRNVMFIEKSIHFYYKLILKQKGVSKGMHNLLRSPLQLINELKEKEDEYDLSDEQELYENQKLLMRRGQSSSVDYINDFENTAKLPNINIFFPNSLKEVADDQYPVCGVSRSNIDTSGSQDNGLIEGKAGSKISIEDQLAPENMHLIYDLFDNERQGSEDKLSINTILTKKTQFKK